MPDEKAEKKYFDVRCPSCGKLACRAAEETRGELELLCGKCRRKNIIHLPTARKENNISTSVATAAA